MMPFMGLALGAAGGGGVTPTQATQIAAAARRQPVETIAEAQALALSDGDVVYAAGYGAAHDGGGGFFRYSASSTSTVDGGITFAMSSSGGRLIRVLDGGCLMNVQWFGARGDNATDDTAAIKAALDITSTSSRAVYFPAWNAAGSRASYVYVGDLRLSANKHLYGEAGVIGQPAIRLRYKDANEKGRIKLIGENSASQSTWECSVIGLEVSWDMAGNDPTGWPEPAVEIAGTNTPYTILFRDINFYDVPFETGVSITKGNNIRFENVRLYGDNSTQRATRPATGFAISGGSLVVLNGTDIEKFSKGIYYTGGVVSVTDAYIEQCGTPLHLRNGLTASDANMFTARGGMLRHDSSGTLARLGGVEAGTQGNATADGCSNILLSGIAWSRGGVASRIGVYLYYNGNEPIRNVRIEGVDLDTENADTTNSLAGSLIRTYGGTRLHLFEVNGRRWKTGTPATPTNGTWRKGDAVFYTVTDAGGSIGAVCTAAGTPGTWKPLVAISA